MGKRDPNPTGDGAVAKTESPAEGVVIEDLDAGADADKVLGGVIGDPCDGGESRRR